ncbi:hypothetical protein [Dyella acidisoli]|uniref:Uncharacterized protein n=1 Tax=Dyella acidisoli TaxID=1867834 RepID=A0ABQ5XJR6_9GAMM|nr:hypothetical protein [Dyella acidisoli]GLQ91602.1 hypothetical protein GCM10007901_05520 [Dyella acidisoli]
MFKIEGLDELTRQLSEAEQAIASIDGDLGAVNFDPHDSASIERAIQAAETLVDEKLKAYAGNSLVESLVEQMKEQLRQGIIDKAAQARTEQG